MRQYTVISAECIFFYTSGSCKTCKIKWIYWCHLYFILFLRMYTEGHFEMFGMLKLKIRCRPYEIHTQLFHLLGQMGSLIYCSKLSKRFQVDFFLLHLVTIQVVLQKNIFCWAWLKMEVWYLDWERYFSSNLIQSLPDTNLSGNTTNKEVASRYWC